MDAFGLRNRHWQVRRTSWLLCCAGCFFTILAESAEPVSQPRAEAQPPVDFPPQRPVDSPSPQEPAPSVDAQPPSAAQLPSPQEPAPSVDVQPSIDPQPAPTAAPPIESPPQRPAVVEPLQATAPRPISEGPQNYQPITSKQQKNAPFTYPSSPFIASSWKTTPASRVALDRPSSNAKNKDSKVSTIGAAMDVGFPDGLMVGASYRPVPWLRAQASAGSNAIGVGLRGGLTWIPFGMGPSLTLEGGNYFDGDANGVMSTFAGDKYESNQTAKRIGYQFANGHVGLDFGKGAFSFFVHGGMSYIRAKIHDVNDVLGGQSSNPGGNGTLITVKGEPSVVAWLPSFKLGFAVFFV